jgi:DDE superfamily endonuclease
MKQREAFLFHQRHNWEHFCQKHGDKKGFYQHMRIPKEALISDCSYTSTIHLVPMYCGEAAKTSTRMHNFNFYASHLCIRSEMAFGLMINRWGILLRPLKAKVRKIKKSVCCTCKVAQCLLQFPASQAKAV